MEKFTAWGLMGNHGTSQHWLHIAYYKRFFKGLAGLPVQLPRKTLDLVLNLVQLMVSQPFHISFSL